VASLPDITPAAPSVAGARYSVATAQDAEIQMLLASVMNWQPRGHANPLGNLMGLAEGPTPSSAMSFSPSLLGLLSDSKG
jgi:hypothetical protein